MKESACILLVDDQPDLLNNLSLTLEAEGYQVLTADDGLKALAVLQTQLVDLILSDIAMPGLNGYQLYEQVRQNPAWGAIPFLFLSARALDSDVRYGKELGVDDYLTKPIRSSDLLSVVQGKLRRAEELVQAGYTDGSSQVASSVLDLGGRLQIAPRQYRVWVDGQPLKLSVREFKLLTCLALRANEVISSAELVYLIMGLNIDQARAGVLLRPLIHSLRAKLGQTVGLWIGLVRGVGYQLNVPDKPYH